MDIYEKTVTFVDDAFGGKQKPHFERTVHWLERFLPNYTEAHRVAAYAHDIERALRPADTPAPDDYLDHAFLRQHQEGGADIMAQFLAQENQQDDFIATVTHLISRHEEGGDTEQNALMNADSVSFFETNAESFVHKKAPLEGYEKIRTKLDWMYERMNSTEAKLIAQPHYEKWISVLESSQS